MLAMVVVKSEEVDQVVFGIMVDPVVLAVKEELVDEAALLAVFMVEIVVADPVTLSVSVVTEAIVGRVVLAVADLFMVAVIVEAVGCHPMLPVELPNNIIVRVAVAEPVVLPVVVLIGVDSVVLAVVVPVVLSVVVETVVLAVVTFADPAMPNVVELVVHVEAEYTNGL